MRFVFRDVLIVLYISTFSIQSQTWFYLDVFVSPCTTFMTQPSRALTLYTLCCVYDSIAIPKNEERRWRRPNHSNTRETVQMKILFQNFLFICFFDSCSLLCIWISSRRVFLNLNMYLLCFVMATFFHSFSRFILRLFFLYMFFVVIRYFFLFCSKRPFISSSWYTWRDVCVPV